MYENFHPIGLESRMDGILTVMRSDSLDAVRSGREESIRRSGLEHHWGVLTIDVKIPVPGYAPEETKDPLRSLFDWIDALDPVPHVDLEAMDRGEIY